MERSLFRKRFPVGRRKNNEKFQEYFENDLLNQFRNIAGILKHFTYSLFLSDIVLPRYFDQEISPIRVERYYDQLFFFALTFNFVGEN